MPRTELAVPRSVRAAGISFSRSKRRMQDDEEKSKAGEPWMRDVWALFDVLSIYRQAPTIQGALISRAKLIVEERDADGQWLHTTNKIALQCLAEFYGGQKGQAQFLRLAGINFTVTGGCWIVSPDFGPAGPDKPTAKDWLTVPETQIKKDAAGNWKIFGKPSEGDRLRFRIHRPHPVNPEYSDSASRATLPDLYQLLQLRKRTSAQIDSRLTGGGVWVLPESTEFPAPPRRVQNHGDPEPSDNLQAGDSQGLMDQLIDIGSIAMEDQASPEARLPIMITVGDDAVDKVKAPINFWSELDKLAPALRKELVDTIAQGMDIPADVLLSSRNSNHWNAWLSDESNIKIHGEPTLEIITGVVTEKYLQPALVGLVPDPTAFRIGADTSEMRLRPNRSAEATELSDRLILSDEAVLRENGFTIDDAMSKEEMAVAIMRKAALGQTTPQMVGYAWKAAGIDIPVELLQTSPPVEGRPSPSLEGHPSNGPPEVNPVQPKGPDKAGGVERSGGEEKPTAAAIEMSWFALIAEQIVDRALQRAGNRIKQKFGLKGERFVDLAANRAYMAVQLSQDDVDDVLQDAWGGCRLTDYGVPAEDFERALDIYARSLMLAQREPDVKTIGKALELLLRKQIG